MTSGEIHLKDDETQINMATCFVSSKLTHSFWHPRSRQLYLFDLTMDPGEEFHPWSLSCYSSVNEGVFPSQYFESSNKQQATRYEPGEPEQQERVDSMKERTVIV